MSFDLQSALEHISHQLPAQGPIKDFIHHNTLHAFQHLPFHEALAEASAFYGAASYMPMGFYGQSGLSPIALAKGGVEHRENIDTAVAPILIRLTSGFLDQGIAVSPFPEADCGFFEALNKLAHNSWTPIAYYANKKRTREWFRKSPERVCEEILKQLVVQEDLYEQYITDTLMAHRGWAGMVNVLEHRPTALLVPRSIRLVEFLALKLILESEYLLFSGSPPPVPSLVRPSQVSPIKNIHEAYENAYYHEILSKFKNIKPAQQAKPHIQAVFCIDDRECSFRRHLEQADPHIETFACAGFFGIDFFFQSINDASPKKLAPAPVQPKHLVFERPHALHITEFENQRKKTQSKALWLTSWLGFVAKNTLKIDVRTELELYREDDLLNQDTKLYHGFTYDEMAERVFSVLNSMGLNHDFAPIILMIAHGSSSLNNPHFAAYDCGACSGNPGAPNARAFAAMANLGPVRERVYKLGISIPSGTRFMGGFHDTCTDSIDFFDTEDLTAEHGTIFSNFLNTLEATKKLNAKERCIRFAVVDPDITPEQALAEVQHRATVLFEPRPELGHVNNALCIVGRRQLTKNLFFDRRAFLNSYDPTQDPTGQILNSILNAVVPVCGGINLEYYFSRVDNAVYGCGTKLSHNVCSLLGVYNGIDDDLRTGLPVQMIEIHEPIRLLIIIEQTPEIVLNVIQNNKPIFEWIENEWVKLACVAPDSNNITFYQPTRGFVDYTL